MEKLGFTRDDLAIFGILTPEERERKLQERVRPRLEEIAYRFASPLSRLTGQPLSASIVMTASPTGPVRAAAVFAVPTEQAPDSPQLMFCLTRGGVHARLAVANSVSNRATLAKQLTKAASAVAKELSGTEIRRYDEWDGRGIPAPGDTGKAAFWKEVAEHLGRERGQLDVGIGWPEARAVLLSYEDLLPAFRALLPLYRRLSASDLVVATKTGRRSPGAP